MIRRLLTALLVTLLASCGGSSDGNQQISQVKYAPLAYGKTAAFYVTGVYLNNNMSVTSDDACQSPTFSSKSQPTLAILTCTVKATGQHSLTIKGDAGQVLYTGTLNVPQPQVTLTTAQGNIVLELNPAVVPATVDNFLAYVNAGFYKDTLFHRVIAGFVVQGGGFTSGMVPKTTGLNAPIALESHKGLSNTRGTVAMARTSDPNSATSQFYVNLVDNSSTLDYQNANNPGYAVFGTVVSGMDVVDAIAAVPTGTTNGLPDVPVTDVTITAATQTQ